MTHYVYELCLDGVPMYVGMTINLDARIAQHRRARGLARIQYGDVLEMCCLLAASDLEASEIIRRRLPWNLDRRTPHQKDSSKATLDQARSVWFAPDNDDLTNYEVAELIPGWSAFMCYDWFGSRYGPTRGGWGGRGRKDIEDRIRMENRN